MDKKAFIHHLAKKRSNPQEFHGYYTFVLDDILLGIQELLAKGEKVQLTGFGTFYLKSIKAHKGYDLKSKKIGMVPEQIAVQFSPGETLKKAISKKKLTSEKSQPQRRVNLPGFFRKK